MTTLQINNKFVNVYDNQHFADIIRESLGEDAGNYAANMADELKYQAEEVEELRHESDLASNEDFQTYEAELESCICAFKDLREVAGRFAACMEAKRLSRDQLQKISAEIVTILDNFDDGIIYISDTRRELKNAAALAKEEASEVSCRLDAVKAERDKLAAEVNELKSKPTDEQAASTDELKAAQNECEKFRAMYHNAADELKTVRLDLEEAQAQAETLGKSVADQDKIISALDHEINDLKATQATTSTAAHDVADDVKRISGQIAKFKGVTLTVKGAKTSAPVVWLAGDVNKYKKELAEVGAKYSNKRKAYYICVA